MKIDKDIATRSSQYIGYLILKYFKKRKQKNYQFIKFMI